MAICNSPSADRSGAWLLIDSISVLPAVNESSSLSATVHSLDRYRQQGKEHYAYKTPNSIHKDFEM